MAYEVDHTDDFGDRWETLSDAEQADVGAVVDLLEIRGPHLPFPHSSAVHGSKHGHMRELRTQPRGRPYRVLYAFDPLRAAILLLGGDKTGKDDWYDRVIPQADRL